MACDKDESIEPIIEVIEEEEEEEVVVDTSDIRDQFLGAYVGYAQYEKYDSSSTVFIHIDTMVWDTIFITKEHEFPIYNTGKKLFLKK